MRLVVKFGIFITLFLLVSFGLLLFMVHQINILNQKTSEISTNWFPATVDVKTLHALVEAHRRYEIIHIYTTDEEDMKEYEAALANISIRISIIRKSYEKLISSIEERDVYDKFSDLWAKYLAIHNVIIPLSQANRTEEAQEILIDQSRNLFEAASRVLAQLVLLNVVSAQAASIDGHETVIETRKFVYIIFPIVALFGVIATFFLSRNIIKQLGIDPKQLVEKTKRVTEGDYNIDDGSPRIGVYGDLLFMVETLKAKIDEAEIAQLNAEESSKAKSEFLANMSHEIRTPLNGVLGLLHLLSNTKLTTQQNDYLQKALHSAKNLLRVISDILDFSKIEAGKLVIERTPFTIREIVEDIQALYDHKVAEKNLTAKVVIEPDLIETKFIGDSFRLRQVLFNLASNALKFTQKGGVELHVEKIEEKDGEVLLSFAVKDSGIGLTPEQKDRLFSSFTQADNSVTRKYGGTGLGLAISKHIVELMHGKIWVESEYGKGSTFYFTARFEIFDQNNKEHLAMLPKQNKKTAPVKEYAPRDELILLVEDNPINQMVAKGLLKKMGFKIEVAENGQEALDMLEKKQYDLVLMDIQMPVMDGLTATSRIRKQDRFANLPVIAMSAHAMSGDKDISLAHGMNDHVTKPISPEILYDTIITWLEKSKKTSA